MYDPRTSQAGFARKQESAAVRTSSGFTGPSGWLTMSKLLTWMRQSSISSGAIRFGVLKRPLPRGSIHGIM